MTTSSLIQRSEPATFEQGKMYQCGDVLDPLVVLCVSSGNTSHFDGVVIYSGSKFNYSVGKYINCLSKNHFTNFYGQVLLKS